MDTVNFENNQKDLQLRWIKKWFFLNKLLSSSLLCELRQKQHSLPIFDNSHNRICETNIRNVCRD